MRGCLHRLKRRSGLKDIYQSKKTMLTNLSLERFYHFARSSELERDRPGSKIQTGPVVDVYLRGAQRLQEEAEADEGELKRFQWPLGGLTIPDQPANDMDIGEEHVPDLELVAWVAGE